MAQLDNVITIVGNLTHDPELRFTQSGAAVVNVQVAQTPRVRDQQTGEWGDGETTFIRASAWRSLAENAAESLKRGMAVVVVGSLKSRNVEKEDGSKVTYFQIDAQHIGPDLTHATVQVTKNVKASGGSAAPANGGGQGNCGGGQPAASQPVPASSAPANGGDADF